MTIDKLDENRVLIILCTKDMEDYRLDYKRLSLNDLHSRKILMRILQIACVKSGIDINGKQIELEAIDLEDSCYILVTINKKHTTQTYRLKSRENICYCLGGCENFLATIEMLYRQNVYCNKNCAYVYNNEYYLIFEYPLLPYKLKRILSEYGKKKNGNTFAARIKENGRELCRLNAIAQIGKHLV